MQIGLGDGVIDLPVSSSFYSISKAIICSHHPWSRILLQLPKLLVSRGGRPRMMMAIIYRSRNPDLESGLSFFCALRATQNHFVRSFSCGECHRRKQKVCPYSHSNHIAKIFPMAVRPADTVLSCMTLSCCLLPVRLTVFPVYSTKSTRALQSIHSWKNRPRSGRPLSQA